MAKITLEQYVESVREQSSTLLALIQSIRQAVQEADVEMQAKLAQPLDIEPLAELASGIELMVGDVRQMMEQQLMANLLLSKRFRERECLNDIGRQTDETPPIPEFLQWVTERVPQAMQYPDDCVVAIEYEGQTCGRPEAADLPRQIVQGLRTSGKLVGRMVIAYTTDHEFLDGESALLGGVARRVSGYIEGQRLFQKTQQALSETELLYLASTGLNEAQDYQGILVVLRDYTLLGWADLNVSLNLFSQPWVGDETPEWSIAVARWSRMSTESVSPRYPLRSFPSAAALLSPKEPTLITDVAGDPRLDDAARALYAQRLGAASTIFVPLVAGGQWIGYVNAIYAQPAQFPEADVRRLMNLSAQAAVVAQSIWRLKETQSSVHRFRDVALISADWVWELGAQGNYTYCSDRVLDVLGYAPEEVVGKPPFDFMPDDETVRVQEIFTKIAAEKQAIIDLESRNLTKDGREVVLLTSGVPMLDEEGALLGYRGVNKDISEQKQIQVERERLLADLQSRAIQLQTAAEVARAASSILDLDELMQQTVGLVCERFNLYYVALFLVEQRNGGQWLLLKAAMGQAGQDLIDQGLELEVNDSSAIGSCIVNAQAHVALDAAEERSGASLPETRSELDLPLFSRGQAIGALSIQSEREAAFDDKDIVVFQTLADQIANAAQNARLFKETQRRAQEQRGLARIASLASSTLEIGEMLDRLMQETVQLVQAENCVVFLADADKLVGRYVSIDGVAAAAPEAWSIPMDAPDFESSIFARGSFYYTNEAQTDPNIIPAYRTFMENLGAYNFCGVALRVREQSVGELYLVNRAEGFGENKARLLLAVASYAAGAIENANLFHQVRMRAEEQSALYDLGQALATRLNVDDVLEETYRRLAGLMDASHFYAVLYDQAQQILTVALNVVQGELSRPYNNVPAGKGITHYVLNTRKPLLIEDNIDERVLALGIQTLQRPGVSDLGTIQSWVGVPLIAGEHLLGMLALSTYATDYKYSERERDILTAAASQAAIALQNANLFQELQERIEEQSVLSELAQALTVRLEVDQVLDQVYQGVSRLLGADNAYIALYDQQKDEVTVALNVADGRVRKPHFTQPAGRSVTAYVLRSHAPLLVQGDLAERFGELGLELIKRPSTSRLGLPACWLGAPIIVGSQLLGLLAVTDYDDAQAFDERDQDMLTAIANQAAIALQNAYLFEQTQVALVESRALYEAGQALAMASDLEGVLQIAIDRMVDYVGVDQSRVVLFDETLGYGQVKAEYKPTTDIHKLCISMEGNPFYEVLRDTGQAVAITDVYTHPVTAKLRDVMAQYDTKSLLLVPFIVRGQFIGSIGLDMNRAQRTFSQSEINFCRTLADQVALAIENQRLSAQTQESLREAQMLYDAGQAISRAASVQEIVDAFAGYALDVDSVLCAVGLYDTVGERATTATVAAVWEGVDGPDRIQIDTGINLDDYPVQRHYSPDHPFISGDVQADERVDARTQALAADYGAASLCNIPLVTRDGWIGSMLIYSKRLDAFDQETLRPLVALSEQATVTIDNRRLLERAQRFARRLQIAADVSQAISAMLDPEQLVSQVVELIRERFDLYYVGLFLLDEAAQWAELRIGTGDAGRAQVAARHRLRVNQESMIGWSVVHKQPRIAFDIGDDPVHFDNPYLPDTHSEMALPLISRDQVIGALTIQSVEQAAFSQEDIAILETVTDQIANALVNARLYTEAEDALQALSATQRHYVQESWRDYISEREGAAGYTYDQRRRSFVELTGDLLEAEVERVLQQGKLHVVQGQSGDGVQNPAKLLAPIKQQEQVIGVLALEDPDGGREWSQDQIVLVEAVATQVALTVDNARLFEQTQNALAETGLLYNTSRAIGSAASDAEVIQALVDNIRIAGLDRVVVALIVGEQDGRSLVKVQGVWDRAGKEDLFLGNQFTCREVPLIEHIGVHDRVIVEDFNDTDLDDHTVATFRHLGVRSAAMLPIAFGDDLLGWLLLETTSEPRKFTDKDLEPYETLISQAAVALQTQRLLDTTARRARRERMIREITDKIHRSTELDKMLETTARELGRALKASRTVVRLSVADLDETLTVGKPAEGDE